MVGYWISSACGWAWTARPGGRMWMPEYVIIPARGEINMDDKNKNRVPPAFLRPLATSYAYVGTPAPTAPTGTGRTRTAIGGIGRVPWWRPAGGGGTGGGRPSVGQAMAITIQDRDETSKSSRRSGSSGWVWLRTDAPGVGKPPVAGSTPAGVKKTFIERKKQWKRKKQWNRQK